MYVATSTLHTPSKGGPLPRYCTAFPSTCMRLLDLCHQTCSLLCIASIQFIVRMTCKTPRQCTSACKNPHASSRSESGMRPKVRACIQGAAGDRASWAALLLQKHAAAISSAVRDDSGSLMAQVLGRHLRLVHICSSAQDISRRAETTLNASCGQGKERATTHDLHHQLICCI